LEDGDPDATPKPVKQFEEDNTLGKDIKRFMKEYVRNKPHSIHVFDFNELAYSPLVSDDDSPF